MKVGTLNGATLLSIAIFGFDGVNALDLTGPLETFETACAGDAEIERSDLYRIRLVSVTGKSFVSRSGIVYKTQYTLCNALPADTMIVPGGFGAGMGEAYRKIAEWLTAHEGKIGRIVSVCGGIYPVARAGLLDGRKVATHWKFVQDVRRRFPKLNVDPAASFVKDGKFYSCAGGTAAIEMTLSLVQEDYGPRRALSVARDLVMRLRPPGDSDSRLEPLQFECGPMDRLADLPSWVALHLTDNLSVEALASRVCLCPRHFGRLFKCVFNTSPAAFVEQLRLDEAKCRLRLARNSVEDVAHDVGFKSADSFRRAFERRLGVSPSDYRRGFHVAIKTPLAGRGRRELDKLSRAA